VECHGQNSQKKGQCSYPYICGLENGNISGSVRKLDKIARALDTTLGRLTKFAEQIELGVPPI
jgi:transcriptional regulator with XRE-family HTH domain